MDLIIYFFYAVLIISSGRLATWILLSLSYNLRRKEVRENFNPKISVVVPAYNEELVIERCIKSLLNLEYSDYEIIIVDDGSSDNTLKRARGLMDSGVKVIHQNNQGKPTALNTGIRSSSGEIIVTVDADTELHKDSLRMIANRFANKEIGAVAGNVKVVTDRGILNVLQSTEYTTGINLVRKSQSILGCVMVVPGPIAALNRDALMQVGGFSDDTFAEDFDITMEILKAGYKAEYEDKAIAYTVAPKNLEDLIKQRRRWYRGMIQVLEKHREMYLRPRYGYTGILGVPNLWFDTTSSILNMFLILLSLFTALFLGEYSISIFGLALYFSLELAVGILALSLDPAPKISEFFALPLLLLYNVFLDGIRLMALTEELVDIIMDWEKPRR